MAKYKTFADFSKAKGLDSEHFPFARAGLNVYRAIRFVFMLAIALLIASVVLYVAGNALSKVSFTFPQLSTNPQSDDFTSRFLANLGKEFGFSNPQVEVEGFNSPSLNLGSLVIGFSRLILFISKLTINLEIILIVLYIALVLLRWHNWERHVFSCDRESIKIEREIKRRNNYAKRLSNIREAISKARSGENSEPTLDQLAEEEALNALNSMRVYVNERDNAYTESVERNYRIEIVNPTNTLASQKLNTNLNDFENMASNATGGKVNFSSKTLSSDHLKIAYMDSIEVVNPYMIVDTTDHTEYCAYCIPLNLFASVEEKIEAAKQKNSQWINETSKVLDLVFPSTDVGARRISVNASGSVAIFKYELPKKLNVQNPSSIEDKIKGWTQTDDCSVTISAGKLVVSMRMPVKMPIDTATVFRDAFGIEDTAAHIAA